MATSPASTTTVQTQAQIPVFVKWAFSAFMAVLVPVYWANYGPTNFLYFCDLALILTLIAVWRNSALAASAAAVGIMIPQLFWCIDMGFELTGSHLSHMTSYMVDERRSLFLRCLSTFHGWLPLFLLYLVAKLGYDKRGLITWTAIAYVACLIAFFFLPAAGTPGLDVNTPLNVNYVFGTNDAKPQQWMDARAYLVCWMLGLFVVFFYPTHLALKKFFKAA